MHIGMGDHKPIALKLCIIPIAHNKWLDEQIRLGLLERMYLLTEEC